MATPRAAGGRLVTSRPPISTRPPVAVSSPATIRRHVVLPQPDGPSSTVKLPAAISIDTRSSATALPQWRLTSISRTDAPCEAARTGLVASSRGMQSRCGDRLPICTAYTSSGKLTDRVVWMKLLTYLGAPPPQPSPAFAGEGVGLRG